MSEGWQGCVGDVIICTNLNIYLPNAKRIYITYHISFPQRTQIILRVFHLYIYRGKELKIAILAKPAIPTFLIAMFF